MINYSEKYVFSGVFDQCLSFDPSQHDYKKVQNKNSEYIKKLKKYNEDSKSTENYYSCVIKNCFDFPYNSIDSAQSSTNKTSNIPLPVTKFDYYASCQCVKNCFLTN